MASENLTQGFMFEIPSNTTRIGDLMFGTPMQYTDGLFINIFLIGFFSMLTIGAAAYQTQVRKTLIFSSFATFGLTFLLSFAGYAGGNQLIPTAVLFMLIVAYNIMAGSSRGATV